MGQIVRKNRRSILMELSDDRKQGGSNEKGTEEYNFCNRNFTMGYAGTVRICSRQYRTVERHNCKYNDQLSADRGWNTDNLQR